jgi:hypothetical protein
VIFFSLNHNHTQVTQPNLPCSSLSSYSLPLDLLHLQSQRQLNVALLIFRLQLVRLLYWAVQPVMKHVGSRLVQWLAIQLALVFQRMCCISASSKGHMLTLYDSITETYASVSVAKSKLITCIHKLNIIFWAKPIVQLVPCDIQHHFHRME